MRIEHFAINVSDPPATADWYGRNLGMKVLRAMTSATFTHFLADEAGRVVMELYKHPTAPIPDYAAMDPFVFHVAFVAADVPGELKRLLAAGAKPAGEPSTTPAGDVLAFFRDPWGVPLQLVKRAQPLQ